MKYIPFVLVLVGLISSQAEADSENPFSGDFFVLEFTKNSPTIHTKDAYAGRHVTPYLGYRNLVEDHWIMGLGINHKSFTKYSTNTELSLWTLQHEAFYIIRLTYPAFLLVGPKILYMLPTRRSYFPVLRDPDHESEIGAGLSMMFTYFLTQDYLVTLRVDRWRGTKTDKFHGFEVAVGFNKKLNSK